MTVSEFYLPTDELHEKIVFCDFDGTITKEETFVAVLKQFSPKLAEEIIPQIYDMTITLREGVRKILEDIPSEKVPEIIEFIRGKEIRKGFEQFLDFLKIHQVPFVIISGGLLDIVLTVIGDRKAKVEAIYALEIDTSHEKIRIISPYEDDNELLSKPKVMALYQAKETVAIGDSITDLNMAMEADIVFARGRLAEYLQDRNKSYYEWNNFVDVMNHLRTYWGVWRNEPRNKKPTG